MKKKLFIRLFLAGLITGCYAILYYQPMWIFKFVAPQYPQGLELEILMTGARGDTFEIDIINHYIGMSKLENAAVKERAIAPYALIGLSAFAFLLALLPLSKKFLRILSLPVLGFPLGFVGTFYWWLYKFGHELDPAAPVTMTPFTPTLLGTGIIGQFRTFAVPGVGFYLACFAGVIALLILHLHEEKSGSGNNTIQKAGSLNPIKLPTKESPVHTIPEQNRNQP